jgi:hypothetical protein
MIQEEFLNDNTLIKHYSDKNLMLLQVETGNKYEEAIDIIPCKYTYEETNEIISKIED